MIRLIDPADDVAMRQVYDVGVAAKSVGRPWFSPSPYSVWLIGMQKPDLEEPQELYGYFDADGACMGTSLLFVPAQDNLDKVYADIDVAPEQRRRGVGGALVDHTRERVRDLGRSTLFVETIAPGGCAAEVADDEYSRFARAQGFTPAWREVTRHLQLPVPDDRLAALAEDARRKHAGYRIETFAGRVPDDLLPGLAELMSLLTVDAPSGDVQFDAEETTPDRLRRTYQREADQGRIRLSALVIDERSGVVAAQSDLLLDGPSDPVEQDGTYVHRDHRGHCLGMAVKVANLQRLQRYYAGRPFVRTMNAYTNQHMVAINAALGFEAVETVTEWITDVTKT